MIGGCRRVGHLPSVSLIPILELAHNRLHITYTIRPNLRNMDLYDQVPVTARRDRPIDLRVTRRKVHLIWGPAACWEILIPSGIPTRSSLSVSFETSQRRATTYCTQSSNMYREEE